MKDAFQDLLPFIDWMRTNGVIELELHENGKLRRAHIARERPDAPLPQPQAAAPAGPTEEALAKQETLEEHLAKQMDAASADELLRFAATEGLSDDDEAFISKQAIEAEAGRE